MNLNQWIEGLVRDLGYVGLGFLTFLENIFPPLPSELILPLGGFLASTGLLSFWGVILAGTLGSLAGSVVLYYVGRYLHEERLKDWAAEHGKWLLLSADDIDKADDWFDSHGGKAVFLCRLIPGIRSLISIPAGASGMNRSRFLLYTAAGSFLWNGLLAYLGFSLGENYKDVSIVMRWALYAVIALLLLGVLWWYLYKRKK